MKSAIKLLLFPLSAAALLAQRPWQQLTVPSLGEVAANFKSPPHEYGAIQPFASWNGPDPKEVRARIVRDFGHLISDARRCTRVGRVRRDRGEHCRRPKHRQQYHRAY